MRRPNPGRKQKEKSPWSPVGSAASSSCFSWAPLEESSVNWSTVMSSLSASQVLSEDK